MTMWAKLQRNPLVLCPLLGYVAGMLTWTGLMIAFGPIFNEGAQTITVVSRLVYTPFVALPWAVVWLFVGYANSQFRGWWVPAASGIGMIAGGAYALAVNYFDGWLAIFLPGGCLLGTLAGLVVGVVTRATWGWLHGWEDSL